MNDEDVLDKLLGESGRTYEEEDVVLAPLLEEINLIQDQSIQSFVRAVLYRAGSHFWSAPSSFSGKYHPPDERGHAGGVLHTKRVVRIVSYIAKAQERVQYELDVLIAAALLHDLTKGVEWKDGTFNYDPMHPYTVDRFVDWVRTEDEKSSSELSSSSLWIDDETLLYIVRLVRCHMGIWSPIPETIPITTMEWNLHLADMLASKLHYIVDGDDVEMWRWEK